MKLYQQNHGLCAVLQSATNASSLIRHNQGLTDNVKS